MQQQNHIKAEREDGAQETLLHPDLVFFVQTAIDEHSASRLADLVKGLHEADISELLNNLDTEYRERYIAMLPQSFTAEQIVHLEGDVLEDVVDIIGAEASAEAISQLESDDAVEIIEQLSEEEQQEVLDELSDKKRQELEEGLAYPEDSAGRLMKREFVAVSEGMTVGEVIDYLRKEQEDLPQDFYSIYVVDPARKPLASILLSRILRNKREIEISTIAEREIKILEANTDQEEVAYLFHKYGLVSAPVVNEKGVIVGVITVDDVVDVIEEEAEEDIMRLGGVKELPISSSFAAVAHQRFPWLCINLFNAFIASTVIAQFATTIEQLVALAALMPVVASLAGNTGTQAMTVTVRRIATRELTAMNSMRIFTSEVFASALNGFYFSLLGGGVAYLIYGSADMALVFAIAIAASLVVGAFAGVVIPLTLSRLKVDPAIASSVFLTTMTDIVAFSTFLGLATLILS